MSSRCLIFEVLKHLERVNGGVAQLGEHLLCKQGVIGSIPFISTISMKMLNKRAHSSGG